MNTAERILDTAVELFNRHGLARVSLRRIAAEIGISHSNLTYHFRNKARIVDAIYDRMKAEMDDAVIPEPPIGLEHYHRLLQRISAFHEKYRFFYLDLLEIARHYPETTRRYRATIAQRFEQYDQLVSGLIEQGLVQPEPEPGLYRALFHSIWVMSTFWLQHEQILGRDHPVMDRASDVDRGWEIMLPYLTDAGLQEFRRISAESGGDGHSDRPLLNYYLAEAG